MTYYNRLHILQKSIQKASCDALLIEDPTNIFYMTGLELSSGKLLVHAKGAHLLVDGRYLELCEKRSPFPVVLFEDCFFESLLNSLDFSHIQKIGIDSEKVTYKNYELLKKNMKNGSKEHRFVELVPVDAPLKLQRAVKDANELQALREAATLGSEGFDFLVHLLKEGISEQECALELEIFWKKRGSKSVAFDPIIAFGPNSSMPHYRAGQERLKNGQVVLLDIGVNLKNYHSDMTRTIFFGEPDKHLLAVHAVVQEAQRAALAICRPNTTCGELDKVAREIIAEKGYAAHFTHSLGHGVGLDIHEYPTLKNTPPFGAIPLSEGMVITIEPGIYLPGIGGIRIEDTVVITKSGYENLTLREAGPLFI